MNEYNILNYIKNLLNNPRIVSGFKFTQDGIFRYAKEPKGY